jgi:hypothetical protein
MLDGTFAFSLWNSLAVLTTRHARPRPRRRPRRGARAG